MLSRFSGSLRTYIKPTKNLVLGNQTRNSCAAFANSPFLQSSNCDQVRFSFHTTSTNTSPLAKNAHDLTLVGNFQSATQSLQYKGSILRKLMSSRCLSTPAYTKEMQDTMTPDSALEELKKGNIRFVANSPVDRDLLKQVDATSSGQFPYATVLSCIDSRTSSELIFDQGIGDIFSIRIAGNFVNEDILGSMEFTCKLAGTKLILVLGHTACGAVKGACDHARLGNLTTLINKIEPAVAAIKEPRDETLRNSSNSTFVDEVAAQNVRMTMDNIRSSSEILAEMEKNGEIKIIGGMYDISTGKVNFYE